MSNKKNWRWLSCYLCVILFSVTMSQEAGNQISQDVPKDMARFDYYRVYRVELDTEEKVELFKKLEADSDSLSFMGHAREPGQSLSILVSAHKIADFADILATYNVQHRVLSYNFQEKIDRCYSEVQPKGVELSKFDWQHYFHLETIYEWIEEQAKQHPDFITLLDIGNSTQGVPIKGLKIAHKSTNKAIFIESGIHAREWISPATATYILNELINSRDEDVQKLARNYNWIVFPSINPDGYKYTFEHDRMWRKNRQLFYSARGVDLNRNYPDHWNSVGSSDNPNHYDYCGPSEASEIETQRILAYLRGNRVSEQITAYISLHSFSQLIMYPYGYSKERVPNYDDLNEFGKRAVARIKQISGQTYVSGSSIETIYPSSGTSHDYAYSQGIPIAYTFELRGPPDSEDWFILPAEQIQPTAEEAFGAIREIVQAAKEKGYFNETPSFL